METLLDLSRRQAKRNQRVGEAREGTEPLHHNPTQIVLLNGPQSTIIDVTLEAEESNGDDRLMSLMEI